MLRKPYRARDAAAIHIRLRELELPVMTQDQRNRFGPLIREPQQGRMSIHYTKHDALREFGPFYLQRWRNRSGR